MAGLGPGASHWAAGEVGRPRPPAPPPRHTAAPPGNQESPPRRLNPAGSSSPNHNSGWFHTRLRVPAILRRPRPNWHKMLAASGKERKFVFFFSFSFRSLKKACKHFGFCRSEREGRERPWRMKLQRIHSAASAPLHRL